MEYDPHGYSQRLTRTLKRLSNSGIRPTDQELIRAFHEHCFSDGLSVPRIEKYVRHLITLGQWTPVPFGQATLDDIHGLLGTTQKSHYADWTKHDLRVTLRRFYGFLRSGGHTELDLSWVKSPPIRKRKLPTDLPTPADIGKMIQATESPRNKAFIMLLYETGARIGELARLRIRDLDPHQHGFEVHLPVEGKRGARRVLVVGSAPYLRTWLNRHPRASERDANLWPCRAAGRPLSYTILAGILKKAATAAQVTKKVNPHNFRHARATHLANHLTEAQMSEFFGWVPGSDMASTYVHLSGRDVDGALLRTYGIQAEPEPTDRLRLGPAKCRQCDTENPPTHSFCGLCGLPLDEKTATAELQRTLDRRSADRTLDSLLDDEEFRALLERKLEALAGTKG